VVAGDRDKLIQNLRPLGMATGSVPHPNCRHELPHYAPPSSCPIGSIRDLDSYRVSVSVAMGMVD
jgi:hypothetical protein